MPTHLEALRAAYHLSTQRGPLHPVSPDLDTEAGMDGNYGQFLQAARDLDAQQDTPTPSPTPTPAHTPGPWHTRATNEDSSLVYEVLTESGGLVAYVVGYNVYDGADDPETDANAARIVACVNALDGIDDPVAALAEVRSLREQVRVMRAALSNIAATPKQDEPEEPGSKHQQDWEGDEIRYVVRALHDNIDGARAVLEAVDSLGGAR